MEGLLEALEGRVVMGMEGPRVDQELGDLELEDLELEDLELEDQEQQVHKSMRMVDP